MSPRLSSVYQNRWVYHFSTYSFWSSRYYYDIIIYCIESQPPDGTSVENDCTTRRYNFNDIYVYVPMYFIKLNNEKHRWQAITRGWQTCATAKTIFRLLSGIRDCLAGPRVLQVPDTSD